MNPQILSSPDNLSYLDLTQYRLDLPTDEEDVDTQNARVFETVLECCKPNEQI